MINTIIFDLDGTLYDETNAKIKAEVLTSEYIASCAGITTKEVFLAFQKCKSMTIKSNYDKPSRNDRELWFIKTLEYLELEYINPREVSEFYWDIVYNNIEPYSDLLSIIKELSSKYKLYILTDELEEIQLKKLIRLRLRGFFEDVFTSDQADCLKPSKELFRYALDRIGESYQNIVIIGDNPYADVMGGNLIGIKTIWLKRGKYSYYKFQSGDVPNVIINNFIELQIELDKLQSIDE